MATALRLSNALSALPAPGDLTGGKLQIISNIEPGMGVLAVPDNFGAPLLCRGDVAVFDTDWQGRHELTEGLYAIEYQKPRAHMPFSMVAERFAANDPVRFEVERSVVQVSKSRRRPGLWWTSPMGANGERIIDERKSFVAMDGPWEAIQITDKLLGPIVGVYRPNLEGGLS